ncbi:hypothetical protein PRK78_000487 [Emydomyces testavorans]|uniref:Uncharacterized protein n=1 Tax=Emydomyces testavorans TaxID=2070801 RepID=A0AAF0DAU1_9EURO|nr:hypothetical protein PRK78_000487 [Emydomyces testavorans]
MNQDFVPYAIQHGIPSDIAAAAKKDTLLDYTKITPTAEPVQFLEHNDSSRAASNAFLNNPEKPELARLLQVQPSDVSKHFRGSELCVCNKLEKEQQQKSLRTDWIYSILALGDLDSSNGLLDLGKECQHFELKAREVLHFRGDLQQS